MDQKKKLLSVVCLGMKHIKKTRQKPRKLGGSYADQKCHEQLVFIKKFNSSQSI